jgi:hypothetical protein
MSRKVRKESILVFVVVSAGHFYSASMLSQTGIFPTAQAAFYGKANAAPSVPIWLRFFYASEPGRNPGWIPLFGSEKYFIWRQALVPA